MKVLFVSSEAYPLIKTGGLADVSHSLPNQLQKAGSDVRLLLPAYRDVLEKLDCIKVLGWLDTGFGTEVRVLESTHPEFDMPIWLVDHAGHFDRSGNPYTHPDGYDWPDNPQRFNQFSHAASLLACDALKIGWRADVVHANDWQTAMVPAYLSFEARPPKTVYTIHNIAYDCQFHYDLFQSMHMPHHWWSVGHGEFYGRFSMMKAGIIFADHVTTVSPRYAEEICTARYGYGFAEILQANSEKLSGIINGIDTGTWNPATDPYLEANYSLKKNFNKSKIANRKSMLSQLDASEQTLASNAPLFGFVGRMAHQKGIDFLLDTVESIIQEHDALFAIIGSGDHQLEQRLRELSSKYPGQVFSHIGYSEELAHLLEAGSDFFVMPSRYEPCGLNQLYSLHYGTPPIVRNTGGLADTVINLNDDFSNTDVATGIVFNEADAAELSAAIKKALHVHANPDVMKSLISNGMSKDVSWDVSARDYLQLYENLRDE